MDETILTNEELEKLKVFCDYLLFDYRSTVLSFKRFEECLNVLIRNLKINLSEIFLEICGKHKKYLTFQRLIKAYLAYKRDDPKYSLYFKNFFNFVFNDLLKKVNQKIGRNIPGEIIFSTQQFKKNHGLSNIQVYTNKENRLQGIVIEYDEVVNREFFLKNNDIDDLCLKINLNLKLSKSDLDDELKHILDELDELDLFRDQITHIYGTYSTQINYLGFKCSSGKMYHTGNKVDGFPFLIGKPNSKLHFLKMGMCNNGITFIKTGFKETEFKNYNLYHDLQNINDEFLSEAELLIEDEEILKNFTDEKAKEKLMLIPLIPEDEFYSSDSCDNNSEESDDNSFESDDSRSINTDCEDKDSFSNDKYTGILPLTSVKNKGYLPWNGISINTLQIKSLLHNEKNLISYVEKFKNEIVNELEYKKRKKLNEISPLKNFYLCEIFQNNFAEKYYVEPESVKTEQIDDEKNKQLEIKLLTLIDKLQDALSKNKDNFCNSINISTKPLSYFQILEKWRSIAYFLEKEIKILTIHLAFSVNIANKILLSIENNFVDNTHSFNVKINTLNLLCKIIEKKSLIYMLKKRDYSKRKKTISLKKIAADSIKKIILNTKQKIDSNKSEEIATDSIKKLILNTKQKIDSKKSEVIAADSIKKLILNTRQKIDAKKSEEIAADSIKKLILNTKQKIDSKKFEEIAAISVKKIIFNTKLKIDSNKFEVIAADSIKKLILNTKQKIKNLENSEEVSSSHIVLKKLNYFSRKTLLQMSMQNIILDQLEGVDIVKIKKDIEINRLETKNKLNQEIKMKKQKTLLLKKNKLVPPITFSEKEIPKGTQIYRSQEIVKGVEFTDPIFKAKKESLCTVDEMGNWLPPEGISVDEDLQNWNEIIWKRIDSIFRNKPYQIFYQGIESSDILQGTLGDCYFLSALSALCKYPELIERLFFFKEKSLDRMYGVNLRINGIWKTILIDDFVPVFNDKRGELAFSRAHGNEMWVILLEKAWAKINGNYAKVIAGEPSEVFDAICNAYSEKTRIKLSEKNSIWYKIYDGISKNYLITAGTTADPNVDYDSIGLVPGHAYSLVGGTEFNVSGETVRLVKLRNPWGEYEWNGDWSDSSDKWSEEIRKKLKMEEEDDGMFHMSLEDFVIYFQILEICKIETDFRYSYLKYNKEHSLKPQISILNVEENTKSFIQLHQKNPRFLLSNGRYGVGTSAYILIVDDKFNYIASACGNTNNITIEANLFKGIYFIITDINYRFLNKNETHGYNITFYSKNPIMAQKNDNPNLNINDILKTSLVGYFKSKYHPIKKNNLNIYEADYIDSNIPFIGYAIQNNNNIAVKVEYSYSGSCSNNRNSSFYPDEENINNDKITKTINPQDTEIFIIQYHDRCKSFSTPNYRIISQHAL